MSKITTSTVADGTVSLITIDDGKANAMQLAWCAEMAGVLDRIEQDAPFPRNIAAL